MARAKRRQQAEALLAQPPDSRALAALAWTEPAVEQMVRAWQPERARSRSTDWAPMALRAVWLAEIRSQAQVAPAPDWGVRRWTALGPVRQAAALQPRAEKVAARPGAQLWHGKMQIDPPV